VNIAVISGRLAQNAIAFGKEKETLKFTVACPAGYDTTTQENKADFVPCVMFRAPEKLRDLLIAQGKGKPVELRGRIITGSYEQQGVTRYATEVVVDNRNFQLLRTGNGTATHGDTTQAAVGIHPQKGGHAYAPNPQHQPNAGGAFY
jgi:single-stranded DNA-binding protein